MHTPKSIIILISLLAVWGGLGLLWKPSETEAQRKQRATLEIWVKAWPFLAMKPLELAAASLPPPKHEVRIHPIPKAREKTTGLLPVDEAARPESSLIELQEYQRHDGEMEETEIMAAMRLDPSDLDSLPPAALDRYQALLGTKGGIVAGSQACACFESEAGSLLMTFRRPNNFMIYRWLKSKPSMIYTGEFISAVPDGDPKTQFGEIASAIVQSFLHAP